MDRTPGEKQDRQKSPTSRIEKGARVAMAGAAFLGAVGASELRAEPAPLQTAHEAQESFDDAKEIEAFIQKVVSMPYAGQSTLSARIKLQFHNLALSLDQKIPYFSLLAKEQRIGPRPPVGAVTVDAQERVRQRLLARLQNEDVRIMPGDMGTEEGVRKNKLRILRESLTNLQ